MTQPTVLDTILKLGLPDHAINIDEVPWVPQGERVWFKPLRFDLTSGNWINLLKVKGGGKVNRHRHSGGHVIGYCVQGSWHYLEREWVARPGTLIFEPPGDIHTLIVEETEEEMQTLFLLSGTIQYLNDENEVIYQDDVFTKLDRYLKYCEANGIRPLELCY